MESCSKSSLIFIPRYKKYQFFTCWLILTKFFTKKGQILKVLNIYRTELDNISGENWLKKQIVIKFHKKS